MKRGELRVATGAALALALAGGMTAQERAAFVPVTDAVLTRPDPGDWLHISRTYDQQRFSPLTQITKSNVGQLRMVWSRGLPTGVNESTPVVYRGVMYLMTPGGGLQAVDATDGDLIWD